MERARASAIPSSSSGTTEVACAWLSGDVRVKVPATIRVVLKGTRPPGVAAKDVMLALLAHPYVKGGGEIGKVLEYAGEGVTALSVRSEERRVGKECRSRWS